MSNLPENQENGKWEPSVFGKRKKLDDIATSQQLGEVIARPKDEPQQNVFNVLSRNSSSEILLMDINRSSSTMAWDAFSVIKTDNKLGWKSNVHFALNPFVVFPMKNDRLKQLTGSARKYIWFHTNVPFETEGADFLELSVDLQDMLLHPLAMFARLDSVVNKNLLLNFLPLICDIPELMEFVTIQIMMETQHGITYATQIHETAKDITRVNAILQGEGVAASIKEKEDWACNWIDNGPTSSERILAFIFVEGVAFCSAFAILNWFKFFKPGKFKGIMTANDYIIRDETLHAETWSTVLDMRTDKPSQERAYEIIESCIRIEQRWCSESLAKPQPHITKDMMFEYIKFIADYWLQRNGYAKKYNSKQPFHWMSLQELKNRTNFFEVHTTNYQTTPIASGTISGAFSLSKDLQ